VSKTAAMMKQKSQFYHDHLGFTLFVLAFTLLWSDS